LLYSYEEYLYLYFIFFVELGLELRDYTLSHSINPFL
jgi:hypothetical protein